MTIKFTSDIDIDMADRAAAATLLKCTPASQWRDEQLVAHNTGIYPVAIPVDPITGLSALDYETAESRGYVKLDLLNVGVYSLVRNEEHLLELLHTEPAWEKLYDPEFCARLIHIGNHYDTLIKMPEAVNSIPRLAMFLAVIRPGKRHLIGKTWKEVAETIWDKPTDGSYFFKRSHSVSYAHLVAVHINLLNNCVE